MKKNMGTTDKTLRIILAIVFAVLIYFDVITGTAAWVLGILAVVFVLTSLMGFCPLYVPIKLNTGKKK